MKIFKEFEGKTAFVTGAASGMGQGRSYLFWRSWLQGGCMAARNPKALKRCRLYGKTAVRRFC